jgi:DNA-binding CsgD family transcriptional regulator
LFEEGLTLSREAGDRHGIAWARLLLASLSLLMGDYEHGSRLYEENLPLARELGDTQLISWHLIDLGYGALLAGDHERATELLEEAAALLRERGHKSFLEYALDNLGWVALARGDHQQAKVLLEESLALCKELGDKMVAAESIEGLACAAGARGEAERAARLFGAAQALREAVGAHKPPDDVALREPYLTETRSLLGEQAWEAYFAEGQRMTFEEAVEYALSEEESTTTSSQAPDQPPAHDQPLPLTHREQEVAQLLARGLTNRQIAEELFLSERTIDRHVSKVLKKLGIPSRAQVAAKMAERHPSNTDQRTSELSG